MSIELNRIICKHCGAEVVSAFRHDFRTHRCDKMKAAYNGSNEVFIAADGGPEYLKRCGNHSDWEEASIWKNDVEVG